MIQKTRRNRFLIYGTLVLLALAFLMPAYMVIITSFKSPDQINLNTAWNLPRPWFWQSFVDAWEAFAPNLANSLSIVIPSTIISSLLGSLNGYVLSKWKFRGANLLFPLMLFGMFIPYQSILIPLFQFLNRIGLYGDIAGLVLVHVIYGIPITTLIFRNYYAEVPTEMVEAGSSPKLFPVPTVPGVATTSVNTSSPTVPPCVPTVSIPSKNPTGCVSVIT